jgi:hypothetical protein
MLEFFLPICLVSCYTRKKFINFNKFIVKCEWKKWFKKEIKYTILYLVPELWFRHFNRLRFRFHWSKSYGSYGSGSGSTTLSMANIGKRRSSGRISAEGSVVGPDPHRAALIWLSWIRIVIRNADFSCEN